MTTRTKAQAADAPAAPTMTIFNAALAAKARERRNAVHDFALTATMPGAIAKVRVPDLGDPDLLLALPDPLVRGLLTVVRDVERREHPNGHEPEQTPETVDIARARQDATRNRTLVDAYCLAGFVNPPLAMTEDDLATPEHVLLADIHPADRTRFFSWCMGQVGEAAATVEPFPDGSPEGVATGGPGGVGTDAPE